MKFWVLRPDGSNASGPHEITDLNQVPGFSAESIVASDGESDAKAWRPAGTCVELRGLFSGRPPLPTPLPEPWSPTMAPPPPSTEGKGLHWYVQYCLPDDHRPRAGMVDGLSKDEVLKFVHKLESLKVCGIQVKPLSSKAPDLKDPKTYRWYIKFQVGKRKPASISPDLNGAEATALKKRYEQMGIKILEMWTTDSSPGMSLDHREKPAP